MLTHRLIKTNEALDDLRHGRFTGAAVIEMNGSNFLLILFWINIWL